jgi:hypothetical protein
MTIQELTQIANDYTDENFSETLVRTYANEAIANINADLKATLPYFQADSVLDYTALDEKWLRVYVAPYIAWSIKMNDGSLNEADRFLMRVREGFRKLQNNKIAAIDEDYREGDFLNGYKIQSHNYMGKDVSYSTFRKVFEGDE